MKRIHHRNGIYYKPDSEQSTHYISIQNEKVKDPYKYFQFPDTHGFCQLFAFFLHINDVDDFQKVNFQQNLTKNNFEKYSYNSFQVLRKLISLLKNPRYKNVRKAMKSDFEKIDRKNFGIQKNATFSQFLKDLEKLTLEQAKEEMGEVFDMYYTNAKMSVKKFWENQNEINKDLCVQPTSGECQFESFQAIIAYSFSADSDSPYVALLKEHNIDLIEDASLQEFLQTHQAKKKIASHKKASLRHRKKKQQLSVPNDFVGIVSNFIHSLFHNS